MLLFRIDECLRITVHIESDDLIRNNWLASHLEWQKLVVIDQKIEAGVHYASVSNRNAEPQSQCVKSTAPTGRLCQCSGNREHQGIRLPDAGYL